MHILGVIPARYQSTRLEGKVLADILGKSMIQHVYERASRACCLDEVVVATVINSLNAYPGSSDDYAERWREGNTLRVLRQEPSRTHASKVLALHVQKPS